MTKYNKLAVNIRGLFKTLFPGKQTPRSDLSHLMLERALERSLLPLKQESEDSNVERWARQEGIRLFFDWLKEAPMYLDGIELPPILLVMPPGFYTIYDDTTAKYKDLSDFSERFAYICSTQELIYKLTTNAYWRIAYIRC